MKRDKVLTQANPGTPCGFTGMVRYSPCQTGQDAVHVLLVDLACGSAGTALCAYHSPFDVVGDQARPNRDAMTDPRPLSADEVAEIHANSSDDTAEPGDMGEPCVCDLCQSGRENYVDEVDEDFRVSRTDYAAQLRKAVEVDTRADRRESVRLAVAWLGWAAWVGGLNVALYLGFRWLDMPTGLQVAIVVALAGRWVASQLIKKGE